MANEVTVFQGVESRVFSHEYAGSKSFQAYAPDLTLAAGAGKDLPNTAFLAAVMGNVLGDALTKTGDYLAGVIGAYSVTGVKGTHMQAGAILGVIMDGVTAGDGALVAVVDGDSAQTNVNAAFAYRMNNSVPGSGVDFGLDLFGAAHDGFDEARIIKASIRMAKEVCILTKAGVPADGIAGTGAGFAEKGSLCVDLTNGKLYVNGGSKASPTWKLVTSAA